MKRILKKTTFRDVFFALMAMTGCQSFASQSSSGLVQESKSLVMVDHTSQALKNDQSDLVQPQAKDEFEDCYLLHFNVDIINSKVNELVRRIETSTISPTILSKFYYDNFSHEGLHHTFLSVYGRTESDAFYTFQSNLKPEKERIEQAIKKNWHFVKDVEFDMMDILNADRMLPLLETMPLIELRPYSMHVDPYKLAGTQTERHALRNHRGVIDFIAKRAIYRNPLVRTMLLQAYDKELQEFKKGNYVFWHGRMYHWDYVAYIFKNFYNLRMSEQNQVGDDYTFLRFDDSVSSCSGTCLNGDKNHDGLFLNHALLGMLYNLGNSSMSMFLNNTCGGRDFSDRFTEQTMSEQFGLGDYYLKYKAEFAKLKALHVAANTLHTGNMLMVVVDKDNIDCVYPVAPTSDIKVSVRLNNGQYTQSAKEIIQELKAGTLPFSDNIMYALPLSHDYALNPRKGLKMYSFNSCDPEKRKEFEDFGKNLFERIDQDIKLQQKVIHEAADFKQAARVWWNRTVVIGSLILPAGVIAAAYYIKNKK
jgi:hypothetical protein